MNQPNPPGGKPSLRFCSAGPASHQPALHYMAEEFDAEHLFRSLLNQAKDLNPDLFARHYFAAAQEHRTEAARESRAFDREQEVDDLFGVLMEQLFDIGSSRTASQQEVFIADIASCCASLDVLQETN